MVRACAFIGRGFSFELENSWSTASFFFATGCRSQWDMNAQGQFTGVKDNFNSPEGLIYNKSRNLFALNFAKNTGRELNLCEGYMDVIALHQAGFEKILQETVGKYEQRYGVKYNISFSVQDPATDIIAVNEDNTPFLLADGKPLYRQ